jgi:hypothetical protein
MLDVLVSWDKVSFSRNGFFGVLWVWIFWLSTVWIFLFSSVWIFGFLRFGFWIAKGRFPGFLGLDLAADCL